ncbi:chromosomal replication initiator protein DnaA [Candidatus Parcubacteria bacterium]|nr:MAG: chromosomal replication initiator protein DnaA [Candidatus Parcubacteria bacterium]
MPNDKLWQATLGELELKLSKANFTTWFKNTFISQVNGSKLVIGVPNAFAKAWLENKYHSHILGAIKHLTENEISEIEYRVQNQNAKLSEDGAVLAKTKSGDDPDQVSVKNGVSKITGLNPRYTFENFIVGKGNELAQAAARACAEKPGDVYNPLFIYGGAGLGKTHLMQAIGHEVLQANRKTKVLYVSSEYFTNEFIQAIFKGSMTSFRERWRSVDVLLVDDVQFLAGKEGTQEEFFHTFNALYQANKQIVLSSDRPPKAIAALEARLLSRFEWGMIADIQEPDLETRIAILRAKCHEKSFNLNNDCLNYVANLIQDNIRELEGALNRIVATHNLSKQSPTLESIKEVLVTVSQAAQTKRQHAVTPKQIIATVCQFYDVKVSEVLGQSRRSELVKPRQMIMYLMREEIQASFPTIGDELGGRDHSTAMHAVEKVSGQIKEDPKLQQDVKLIRQRLYV